MTREEKLYSMKMADLANVADKLGIKINKKAAKSEAVEKILAAEEMKEKAENDAYIAEIMQQKKDLGIECPPINPKEVKITVIDSDTCADGTLYSEIGKEIVEQAKHKLVQMPGTQDPNWGQKHFCEGMIDEAVFAKFVKKAQKLITQAIHDDNGYHVTINVNGKELFYHDKNLQNIRSAIGHIYRGEVQI